MTLTPEELVERNAWGEGVDAALDAADGRFAAREATVCAHEAAMGETFEMFAGPEPTDADLEAREVERRQGLWRGSPHARDGEPVRPLATPPVHGAQS